jgi:hypothetical protein
MLDLVTFPEDGDRPTLTDRLRRVPPVTIRRLLQDLERARRRL